MENNLPLPSVFTKIIEQQLDPQKLFSTTSEIMPTWHHLKLPN